jgi:hypothetical protein
MKPDFQKKMNDFIMSNNDREATFVVFRELGKLLADNKEDFKEVLQSANVAVPYDADDNTLIDLFISNAPQNKKLLISSAFFINHKNAYLNADGDLEISDDAVKQTYSLLDDYFDFDGDNDFYSAGGGAPADPVSAIATALGKGAELGTAITQAKSKRQFGTIDAATKMREGKSEMFKALIEKKKAREEARSKSALQASKNKRIIIIGAVSLVVIIVGIIAYKKLRSKA